MRNRTWMGWWLVLVLLPAAAQTVEPDTASEDKLTTIVEQQRALQAALDHGGNERITTRQPNVIRKAQTEVFAITDGKTRLDELDIDDKVRLENALERINAQVVGTRAAQDGQQVCWREAKSGSTVKVTRCGSQAERDQVREGARAYMEKPKICIPPGC